MKKLYLMRHSQTLFNVLHKLQGHSDSPLTELGVSQAKRAGAWIEAQDLHFDACFSSASERACETLELALPHQAYVRKKNLKEMSFGLYEGSDDYLVPARPYGDYFCQFGGESDTAVLKRLTSAIQECMDEVADGQSVLIVGHGASIGEFLRSQQSGFSQAVSNCSIAELDYDGSFHFIQMHYPCNNADEHLLK